MWTNFDPVNFCPFDTFLEKHTLANKSKIELEVVGQPIQTLPVYWQKGFHFDTNFTLKCS